MNLLNTIFAVCVTGIALRVLIPVLREHSFFRFPTVMAILVCLLIFLGLRGLGDGWISGILLGYAALGVTIAIVTVLALIFRLNKKK